MSEIPTAFGGFAPFPNTIMIPTMGLQSDVIGFRFGFGYEKGKRTLRAMSNEQFNNLDEEAEQAIYKHHEATAIHFFQLELQTWTNLQHLIIEKSVEVEMMKAKRTPSAFREIFQGFTEGFTEQQSQDAKDFFASAKSGLLNFIGFFSGSKQKISTPQPPHHPAETKEPSAPINDPSVPPSFDNPPPTNIPPPKVPTVNAQQEAEKALVMSLLSKQKAIIREIELLHQRAKTMGTGGGAIVAPQIKNANIRLQAASLNLNKLQARYKDKYGVWLT